MSNMWKVAACLGFVLVALSACYLAGGRGAEQTESMATDTKIPTEDKLVMAEDFGLGIRVGTPEADVISRLGEPVQTIEEDTSRLLIFNPSGLGNGKFSPLGIGIVKPSCKTYAVYVFSAKNDWVREKVTLFGRPIEKVSLDYLQSLLPSGNVKDSPLETRAFSWESAQEIQLPDGVRGRKYRITAVFGADGVLYKLNGGVLLTTILAFETQ